MRYNKIHARCTSHLSMKTNCLLVTRVIYIVDETRYSFVKPDNLHPASID